MQSMMDQEIESVVEKLQRLNRTEQRSLVRIAAKEIEADVRDRLERLVPVWGEDFARHVAIDVARRLQGGAR